MSLALAVPLGVASSVVYGTSIVVQHRCSHGHEKPDLKHLMRLLRNPLWLTAILGDFVGFLLNIAALAAGPVVVIQPLVVLMLPVALVAGWAMGGPRPRPTDYLSSLAILGGLGMFLGLIGRPGPGHTPHARWVALAVLIVLAVGVVLSLSVRGRTKTLRAAMYGAVAGTYFGTLGVMVDGASDVVATRGWGGLVTTGRGLVPLVAILLLGFGGILLTQVSFQVGALAATLPANLSADPFTAVLIGAFLLREHIPLSAGHLVLYAVCLAAVVYGAVRLANTPQVATDVTADEPAEETTTAAPAA